MNGLSAFPLRRIAQSEGIAARKCLWLISKGNCYFQDMKEKSAHPVPGWLVHLTGHGFDLNNWENSLRPPFDPWCDQISDSGNVIFGLRSKTFDDAEGPDDVRQLALPLIAQLNGAFAVLSGGEPLKFEGVTRIREDGSFHRTIFGEAAMIVGRFQVSAVAQVLNSAGNLIPPDKPKPSQPQYWVKVAESDDSIADMLTFAGRSDNWFDIYKTIEMAEKITNGESNIKKLLGSSANEYKNLKETANFYRHARTYRPSKLTTLQDAKSLLSFVVRTVLADNKE